MPSLSRIAARKSAALRVSPGGFEVSIATYCCSRRVTSSCVCDHAKDTKVMEDTKASNAAPQIFTRIFVPFVVLCALVVSDLFECPGLTVLPDVVPGEAAAVHRDV